jgi:hypothetical protein
MDATNSDITTGDTEYDNQDDVSLPGDEIEPNTDTNTDPDMNDRLDISWHSRNIPGNFTPTDIEIEQQSDDFQTWGTVNEIDGTPHAIEALKRSQQ